MKCSLFVGGTGGQNRGKPGTDGTFSGILSGVARLPQVVVADVTQRGNGRQFILDSDAERMGRDRATCFLWRNQEMFRLSPVFPRVREIS
jgi:hypothetical protein